MVKCAEEGAIVPLVIPNETLHAAKATGSRGQANGRSMILVPAKLSQ
jgi:hypothetical protein